MDSRLASYQRFGPAFKLGLRTGGPGLSRRPRADAKAAALLEGHWQAKWAGYKKSSPDVPGPGATSSEFRLARVTWPMRVENHATRGMGAERGVLQH